jgi:hypothetical protein
VPKAVQGSSSSNTVAGACISFLSWTSSHGSSLTHLNMYSSYSRTIRQLPCPNLRELSLMRGSVQLCAGSEGPGLLHSCPALTKLVVSSCALLDGGVPGPAWEAPAAVARLQCLSLGSYVLSGGSKGARKVAQAFQERLLPHLTSLTRLHLSKGQDRRRAIRSCFLQHISTIVQLQKLSLWGGGEEKNAGQSQLVALNSGAAGTFDVVQVVHMHA